DKMSPLSDTTNLAAGLTNTDLFDHIKHMVYTTIPGLIIALIVFWYLGKDFGKNASGIDNEGINQTLIGMQEHFVISPFLLLVQLAVIALVVFKVPAIPAIATGVILGFFAEIFVQGHSVAMSLDVLQNGFVINSENEM